MGTLPYGTDQLIDVDMARSLHADACRGHALVAWVVLWDLPAYPERFPVPPIRSQSPMLSPTPSGMTAIGAFIMLRRSWRGSRLNT
jgi:hypothetical protein